MATNGHISVGPCNSLDAIRQRAQKAAEYYLQQQQLMNEKGGDGTSASSHLSSGDYQIIPHYADHYQNDHNLEGGQADGAGNIGLCNNLNKFIHGVSSNPALAAISSTSVNHTKMRAGIFDLRSSYSEHISGNPALGRARTYHGPHTGSRTRTQTYILENKHPVQQQQPILPQNSQRQTQYKTYTTNRSMLNRSSSNTEVDSGELDSPSSAVVNLHREYGSTSSLDVLSTNSDNFFSMLSEFRQQCGLDQRSPAPPRFHQLLQGNLESSSEPHIQSAVESSPSSVRFMNGSASGDKASGDPAKSKMSSHKERTNRAKSITCEDGEGLQKGKYKFKDGKLRAKSIAEENGISILKKLRGKIDFDMTNGKFYDRSAISNDSPSKGEKHSRRRAFVHFDCQSVGVDLNKVIHQRIHGQLCPSKTTTGASAASGQRSSLAPYNDDPHVLSDSDEGDGKSNELVLSCPFFRNELGGEDERTAGSVKLKDQIQDSHGCASPVISADYTSQFRHPACCGVAILDSSSSPSGQVLPPLVSHRGHVVEYIDHGAYYYRHFFYTQDHQNFFGMDENLGPVAISVRREKLVPEDRTRNLPHVDYGTAQYRIICRTSELRTLRGCVLEETIPSRISNSRGIPIKDVLEVAVPQVQMSCLRQAVVGQKTSEQLLKLDEQGIINTYKVGVMYCKSGQATEEEMYNNETSGPALEEFLNLISQKVRLKGFEKYRAGLDCKTDTTGTHSYYTTFNNSEIMFHVSTLLPYTPNNKQQLLRKRHIGNDIVTILFQEPGSLAFTPQTVRSQFQHVFIIVRVSNPNTDSTRYSIAVTRSKDVPPFGPHIPKNCSFRKSQDFVDFLLAKVINAENAAHKSDKFLKMATRTREEYLKDLAKNFVTNIPIDSGSKFIFLLLIAGKFGLGSGRKKDKSRQKVGLDMFAKGALVWEVQVEDLESASQIECLLAIAADTIILVEQSTKDVIFTIPCSMVIGWAPQPSSLRLYYGAGECLLVRPNLENPEEILEIITRLQAVTNGAEAVKLALKRNDLGHLGFHIQPEGVVTYIEPYGLAWEAGLRKGSRLVEICKVATVTLSHEQILDLLRTSVTVKVVAVSPLEDGTPRGNASLNIKPLPPPNKRKATPSSSKNQQPQPQPPTSYKSSPRQPTDGGHSYQDSSISSGQSSCDGRSRSRQDLADVYKSHHSSQENFAGSGIDSHSRSISQDTSNLVTPGVSPRLHPNQHGQTSHHKVDHLLGPSDASTGSSSYSTTSLSSSTQHNFVNMEYTSKTPTTGNISLELLKQFQNQKHLYSKTQGRSHDSLLQPHGKGSNPGSATDVNQLGSIQNFHRNDFIRFSRESRQRNSHNKGRTSKPVMIKGCTEPPSAIPRVPLSYSSDIASEDSSLQPQLRSEATGQKPPRQTAKDFQEELLRLIDPNLSENDLVAYSQKSHGQPSQRAGQLLGTLSDDCLHSSQGLSTYKMADLSSHRLSPRAVPDLTSATPRSKSSMNNNVRTASHL